jgi:hypothetical protein
MAKTLTLVSVPAYTGEWLISGVIDNPKRPGTKAWHAYEFFFGADTVADFAAAHGKGWRSEIEWCAARGFIFLMDPAEAASEEEETEEESSESHEMENQE